VVLVRTEETGPDWFGLSIGFLSDKPNLDTVANTFIIWFYRFIEGGFVGFQNRCCSGFSIPRHCTSIRVCGFINVGTYSIPFLLLQLLLMFSGGSEPRLVKAATDQLNKLPFYHSFWNRTTKPSLVYVLIFL
jgi:hypothetical protein